MTKQPAIIILTAGKGTRMQSSLPKVLHKVAGFPMVWHAARAAMALNPTQVVTVVAPGMGAVEQVVRQVIPNALSAIQNEQLGTAHAVQTGAALLKDFSGPVLILYGDTPLIRPETLQKLLNCAADVAVLGMRPADPTGYGRLVVDNAGNLQKIVEEKDASDGEKKIPLCNSGVMAVRGDILHNLLAQVKNTNAKGEYYLTDIIEIAARANDTTRAVEGDWQEFQGVNSRTQLAEVEHSMQQHLRTHAMENGVTLIAPGTVFFAADTMIAPDVTIHPQVVFGPGVQIETGAEIKSFSHIEGAKIGANAVVGPFARLRPGAVLGSDTRIGNFVEIKNANFAPGAKASHLSYVGDADVGAGANIGAGTITCNYDGVNKHHTHIGAGAFIGSNTALVAPISVGDNAMVGAGSVITSDVEAGALALSRAPQVERKDRAKNQSILSKNS